MVRFAGVGRKLRIKPAIRRYYGFYMRFIWTAIILAILAGTVFPQVQGAGGPAAGLGKVYEGAGRSAASQGLQRKMNTALIRAVAKEKSASRPVAQSGRRGRTSVPAPAASPSSNNNAATIFRPDPRSNYLNDLANELGTNPVEREQLQLLFAATKEAFENEVAAKGRSKDISAAFTFFIATAVTVYRNDPEPSDAAIDNLWAGMSSALTEMPEVTNLTNAEKQQLYDMLIGFSGFLLAGYAEGQTAGGEETQKLFRQVAGVLIQTILKTDPDKLRFTKDGLDIAS